MLKLTLSRLKILIPMLLIISIMSFALLELAPGDPADAYITPLMSYEEIENIKSNMGLDKPVYIRYLNWIKNTINGDLGISYINHVPVAEQVMEKFENTLVLMVTSLIVSIIVSIPMGVLFAVKKGSIISNVGAIINNIGVSIPSFWIGMILIGVFSVKLGMFPTAGMHSIGNNSFLDLAKHLVLPVITISLYNTAIFTNYVEASVSQELKKQYVVTARAKGFSERVILFKHVLINSLTSIITILGMSIQRLVTGAFITEVVFGWPGMGRLMIDSIFSRDYPMIMAITMLSALFLILGNLISDILYILVNPKIKANKEGF